MTLFFGAYTQFFDANGDPMSGAKLYFYEAGTTTPKDTYTDYTLGTPNANPVEADADGRMGGIWLGPGAYKAILKTAGDATIWSVDYVTGNQLDILTTRGDLLTRGASAYARLALGTAGYGLVSDGSDVVWAAIPSLSGSNSWAGAQTYISTDASSSAGPVLRLYRNSATPANNDLLGAFSFDGNNASGVQKTAANMISVWNDVTAGSEDGQVLWQTMVAGTLTNQMSISLGMLIGAATGGAQGTGTINATNFYKNGVLLTFQTAYDSGELTITSAGPLNLTHSLGAKPAAATFSLVCKTAEAGYSVGDEVLIFPGTSGGGNGFSARLTTTQVQLRYGSAASPFNVNNFSSGADTALTNANWRLRIRAFV